MEIWQGKVALVSGASSGIGAAIAESLVKIGMHVVGLARRLDRLEEVRDNLVNQKGKFYPVKTNLIKEENIISAFEWIEKKLGGIHILVNSAAIPTKISLIEDAETDDWRLMYNVNVIALQICTREALKSMRKHNIDDGYIINISSLAAHMTTPAPGIVTYFASKKAVNTIGEGLRAELEQTNSKIRVTTISPGLVKTEIIEKAKILIPTEMQGLEASDIAKTVELLLQLPPYVLLPEFVVRHVCGSISREISMIEEIDE
ncbi:farnesol dehydrogenase-like [Lycorma delicatula]|uniref:farnesol dehydrogenase-like n=1 Tax=Lycorma delicatula TaxID=130591 RepID=UPI003F515B56